MIIKNLTKKSYSIVTPYIIPKTLTKKVNAGDGFIFDSAVKLIGYNPQHIFSSREALNEEKIKIINTTKILVIAGANILKDDLEIMTGFDLLTLKKIKIPIVLMGMGHYGLKVTNRNGLNLESKNILNEIINRFPLVSVRCCGSYEYLKKSLGENIETILNTSCPVIFKVDELFKNYEKKRIYDQLVVTITDRELVKEQLAILNIAPNLFKSKKLILSLHQNYKNINLMNYAKKIGYEIFISDNYIDYIQLYKNSDIHFGNRVHAHLKCLSLGIPSFCTPFDLRQYYFSKSIGLPLIEDIKNETLYDFPFKNFINNQKKYKITMDKFVSLILKKL